MGYAPRHFACTIAAIPPRSLVAGARLARRSPPGTVQAPLARCSDVCSCAVRSPTERRSKRMPPEADQKGYQHTRSSDVHSKQGRLHAIVCSYPPRPRRALAHQRPHSSSARLGRVRRVLDQWLLHQLSLTGVIPGRPEVRSTGPSPDNGRSGSDLDDVACGSSSEFACGAEFGGSDQIGAGPPKSALRPQSEPELRPTLNSKPSAPVFVEAVASTLLPKGMCRVQ